MGQQPSSPTSSPNSTTTGTKNGANDVTVNSNVSFSLSDGKENVNVIPEVNSTSNTSTIKAAEEETVQLEPPPTVGVVVIGLGQRLETLLIDLLTRYGGGLHNFSRPGSDQRNRIIEIRAICDPSEDALKERIHGLVVALRSNLPQSHTKGVENLYNVPVFTDHKQLFLFAESQNIDFTWVMIGSKNFLHRDHCVHAFLQSKNVFCEKPLATTIDHCHEIRKAHHKSNMKFATGFVLRHAPFYIFIHDLVTIQQTLGQIISVEANETLAPGHGGYIMRNWRRHRSETGPHLLEKCSHDIDILNWIINSLPTKTASFAGLDVFTPKNKPSDTQISSLYSSWPAWENIDPFESDKDTEDNQVVIMEYRNKVRVTFHTNCNSALPERKIKIFGVKGTLFGDLLTGEIVWRLIGGKMNKKQCEAVGMHGGADELIVDDLVECMREGGGMPKASGEEGLRSAVACLAADKAREDGTVVDLEPIWKRFDI